MLNRITIVVRTGLVLTMLFLSLGGCGLLNQSSSTAPDAAQGAVLGRTVTAEGIGDHNAPVNETSTFKASDDRIYVVAEAQSIDPGTILFARWSRDGQPFEDSPELKANQAYQDTFVEFHLEPVSGDFDPGQYKVQLFVNGNPAKEAAFSVQ
jgi:hypothetical protein